MSMHEERPTPHLARLTSPAAWLLGLLGVALGVGATLWWVDTRAPPPTLRAGSELPQVERPPEFRPSPASNTPSSGNSIEPEIVSPSEASARQAVQFSGYESAFRQDRLDPSWAPGAEKTLMEAATDPSLTELGAPKEFDASCLGHLCKVTVSFETEGQAGDWAELYVLGMADAVSFVQTMRTTTADGRPQLVLYGARKGSERLLAPPPPRPSASAGATNSAVRD